MNHEHWLARAEECQKGLEIALGKIALVQHPGQLRLDIESGIAEAVPSSGLSQQSPNQRMQEVAPQQNCQE